jgi:opacity protein-like surface antigen
MRKMQDCAKEMLIGLLTAVFSLAQTIAPEPVGAQAAKWGLGFRGGVGRLDGDGKVSGLNPVVSGVFSFSPVPHLILGSEIGFADLQLGASADTAVLRIVPLELNLKLRFAPYGKLTPFVSLGGGGVYWQHLREGTRQTIVVEGQKKENFDYFLKTAGGLDIFLSPRITWTVGAAYRYAFTDRLDLNAVGDQKDAVITGFTGFTVNIGKTRSDADHDGVLDRYDLDASVPEDRDGYLDHDGVPDSEIGGKLAAFVSTPANNGKDKVPPIVIHYPILRATAGRDIHLRAEIFENHLLRKAAILYRPVSVRSWLVEPLATAGGNLFMGTIPGMAVQKPGLEYCVVAVDEAISGVGYSGLPDRPNFISVHGSETGWRIVSGLAAAAGWGAASYLVFRKQQ